jgi:tetratricopeptide (TPR) repeat protein
MRKAILILATFMVLLSAACLQNKSQAQQASDALNAGLQAHAAGKLDEASKDYHDVLTHDPQNKYAMYNLGVIAQTQGQLGQAENYYRSALAVDPNFSSALFNLAIIRANAGSTQEAIDLYRRAIAADPNNGRAHLNLGILLRATGQSTEGDSEIATALQLDRTLVPPPTPTSSR